MRRVKVEDTGEEEVGQGLPVKSSEKKKKPGFCEHCNRKFPEKTHGNRRICKLGTGCVATEEQVAALPAKYQEAVRKMKEREEEKRRKEEEKRKQDGGDGVSSPKKQGHLKKDSDEDSEEEGVEYELEDVYAHGKIDEEKVKVAMAKFGAFVYELENATPAYQLGDLMLALKLHVNATNEWTDVEILNGRIKTYCLIKELWKPEDGPLEELDVREYVGLQRAVEGYVDASREITSVALQIPAHDVSVNAYLCVKHKESMSMLHSRSAKPYGVSFFVALNLSSGIPVVMNRTFQTQYLDRSKLKIKCLQKTETVDLVTNRDQVYMEDREGLCGEGYFEKLFLHLKGTQSYSNFLNLNLDELIGVGDLVGIMSDALFYFPKIQDTDKEQLFLWIDATYKEAVFVPFEKKWDCVSYVLHLPDNVDEEVESEAEKVQQVLIKNLKNIEPDSDFLKAAWSMYLKDRGVTLPSFEKAYEESCNASKNSKTRKRDFDHIF